MKKTNNNHTQLPSARQIALNVLMKVWDEGAYANLCLNMELNKYKLPELERRFATELSYGAVKAGGILDLLLGRFVSRPLNKIPSAILNIMRLAVYQIFYLDKVPDSAACNEAVKQARKFGHEGTVKFVNGVLRSVVRWKEDPGLASDAELAKAVRLQHPDWLIKLWEKELGQEATIELCMINNLPAPVCLRANSLKTGRDELAEVLTGEGVKTSHSLWVEEGLVCEHVPPLAGLASFKQGLYQVQDESSMLAAHFLDVQPEQTVLDLCAAPGGKTTHIAELMQNKGKVIASDIHEHKLKIIQSNCQRLGISIIETCLQDATVSKKEWLNKADRVLVDAPCSGLGVLRRRADLRWRKQQSELVAFPVLQGKILENAASYLKPGGKLLYSTCTTEKAENIDVINAFLENNPDFSIVQIRHPREDEMLDFLQLWPQIDNTDGFFLCLLQYKK